MKEKPINIKKASLKELIEIKNNCLRNIEDYLEKINKSILYIFERLEEQKASKKEKLKFIKKEQKKTEKQEKEFKLIFKDEEKLEIIIELLEERKQILEEFEKKISEQTDI